MCLGMMFSELQAMGKAVRNSESWLQTVNGWAARGTTTTRPVGCVQCPLRRHAAP
jgi:hypothetical protein